MTSYTIVHRRKAAAHSGYRSGKATRIGYRSSDFHMMQSIAQAEADSGEYSMVKIVDADTDDDVAYFTRAHQ